MKRRKGRELQMLWKWKAQEVERRVIFVRKVVEERKLYLV